MKTVQLFGFPSYTDSITYDEFHGTTRDTLWVGRAIAQAVRRLSTATSRVPSQVGFLMMKWH
jgi:hypothetical protein